MKNYIFSVPILPGKTDDLKKYIREMNGQRMEEYKKSNQMAGLHVEQFWLQHTPQGDTLVVRWETENPSKAFEQGLKSTEPFNTWFRDKVIIECLGVNPSDPMPLNELLNDYQIQMAGEKKDQKTYQESFKK